MKLQERAKKSFRDPLGYVLEKDEKIFRFLKKEAEEILPLLDKSEIILKKIHSKKLISYRVVSKSKSEITLQHPKIWFPNYPYEWCYSMLHSAACLTNELSADLLNDGLGLKDATPYNIIFENSQPIFVDLASIEKRKARNSIWLPYSQFLKMFLLPLIMNKSFSLGFSEIFFSHCDGISPEYCSHFGKWWKKDFLFLIYLPSFLSRFTKNSTYSISKGYDPEVARFILKRRFKKNKKFLAKLEPSNRSSKWSSYMSQLQHYPNSSFKTKEAFVQKVLQSKKPSTILDIGCNTGHFSKLAAKNGGKVVAIDYDSVVIEKIYQESKQENLNILPLVVNIARPTPSLGWKNKETWSFLERAQNKFEMVFMLAIIHHLLITERIPLREIASLVSNISTKWAIIEFVEPSDPMFVQLQRGRNLYSHLIFENFKQCFEKFFFFRQILNKEYHPTRKLVLIEKKYV